MDEETGIGPEYTVPAVSLGVDPSVVYRIVAPAVVVDSVTLCAGAYIPGDGEKVGAATVPVIVYAPLDTEAGRKGSSGGTSSWIPPGRTRWSRTKEERRCSSPFFK
jgi:hypothetical protein